MIIILILAALVASLAEAALVISQHRRASREAIERGAYEAIFDRQRDLINRSLEGSTFRSSQGERSPDLAEDPHDEAFQAAWIDPSQEIIDEIDAVVAERDRRAIEASKEAARRANQEAWDLAREKSKAQAVRETLAGEGPRDGWAYDPKTDSWIQVAVPQPTRISESKPTYKVAKVLQMRDEG